MASEFQRIRWLTRLIGADRPRGKSGGLRVPAGDDAAVWRPPAGRHLALTADVQVEGVHFRRGWLTPRQLGRRAVAIAASDLAAMAAAPAGILIAISLPASASEGFFRGLFRGLTEGARSHGLQIFGGNLSRGELSIAITAIGAGEPGKFPLRSGARAGDGIWITGRAGRARLGRAVLESRRPQPRTKAARDCLRAFRQPAARFDAARMLAGAARLHAMIDVSDGLAADLGHILEASGRGKLAAVLDAGALLAALEDGAVRPGRPVAALAHALGIDPLAAVLEGGEDYELLFTAGEGDAAVIARCSRKLGLPISRIGAIRKGRGGLWIAGAEGRLRRWTGAGFDHFA